MKTCFKCGTTKAFTEFYRHNKMSDGYLGKCKVCTKLDVLANYRKNFDHYQNYDKQRSTLPYRRELSIQVHQNWKKRHPEKRKAHEILNNAVRDGKVIPQLCWICGNKGEAHHTHYSHPLEVVWLCSKHHKEVHRMVR